MIQKDIIEMIEKFQVIIIHHHVSPDCDCIGSQLGLKYLILASYPEKKVYAVGENTDRTAFLGPMDKISDDIYQNALVFIVDVGDKKRIEDDRYLSGKAIIKIDHHPLTEEFCDLEWVDTSFPAATEMIIDLYLQNKDKLTMNEEAARVLYAGLLTDTGRYYFNSVTDRTLKYGAEMYKYSFDKQQLYANLYHKSIAELKFKGYIENNFEFTKNGLGYMKITQELLDKFNVEASFASGMVNTLANITEIVVWLFFTDDKELGKIRTSFRSRGPIVNKLAAKYGGGGHIWASGTLCDNWETVDNVIKDADLLCKEFNEQ